MGCNHFVAEFLSFMNPEERGAGTGFGSGTLQHIRTKGDAYMFVLLKKPIK